MGDVVEVKEDEQAPSQPNQTGVASAMMITAEQENCMNTHRSRAQQVVPPHPMQYGVAELKTELHPHDAPAPQQQSALYHPTFAVHPDNPNPAFPTAIQSIPHHDAGVLAPQPIAAPVLITRPSSAKGSKGPLVCQVQGCNRDLSQEKKYYKRYRVCMEHLKMQAIYVDGELARFCQQCGRFHDLSKFDGQKRNCRERLSQHNRRRRKSKWASMGGGSDGSWDDTPATPEVKVPRGRRSKRQQTADRQRAPTGGFWDVAEGQAPGPHDAIDEDRADKAQTLTALAQGTYAVGQPSTNGLGTVEGIPVSQGFRRTPVQVGGTRSAFKQFADGTVQGSPAEGAPRPDNVYDMMVHPMHSNQPHAPQALVHMGHPGLPGRTPDGMQVDGVDPSNPAGHMGGISPMPMLLIPAASAAEIMQQLRGSAVALIPTASGTATGMMPLPIQGPQPGGGMIGPAVAMPGTHPLAITAPQWIQQGQQASAPTVDGLPESQALATNLIPSGAAGTLPYSPNIALTPAGGVLGSSQPLPMPASMGSLPLPLTGPLEHLPSLSAPLDARMFESQPVPGDGAENPPAVFPTESTNPSGLQLAAPQLASDTSPQPKEMQTNGGESVLPSSGTPAEAGQDSKQLESGPPDGRATAKELPAQIQAAVPIASTESVNPGGAHPNSCDAIPCLSVQGTGIPSAVGNGADQTMINDEMMAPTISLPLLNGTATAAPPPPASIPATAIAENLTSSSPPKENSSEDIRMALQPPGVTPPTPSMVASGIHPGVQPQFALDQAGKLVAIYSVDPSNVVVGSSGPPAGLHAASTAVAPLTSLPETPKIENEKG
ncbi:hypothetical protein BSKO_12044 [Bryopsis sp. KO-2023]|nr:hypothetical protein BSKO_12044 [Bryopsis sp. KO-2023]